MSEPITSVTEGRVTVTANDTVENIRAAAGFAESEPPDTDTDGESSEPTTETAKSAGTIEREPDGKFKAKAPEQPAKPAEDAKKSGDPRKSYQAKIDQAIAKQREAERRAEDAERRAAEREAELRASRQPAEPAKPAVQTPSSASAAYLQDVQRYQALPNAPRYEDFVNAGVDDPYGMHQVAMAAFIADARDEERQARRAEEAQHASRQTKIHDALVIASERHPDFPELFQSTTQTYPDAVMEQLRLEAVHDPTLSADLFHHLLTHPDDAAKLATMTHPIAAAREVGRLIAQVSSASSGPEILPSHTTAKPLIKPVRPSVMASGSVAPDDLPFGPRYIAAMNEQERKAREARRA